MGRKPKAKSAKNSSDKRPYKHEIPTTTKATSIGSVSVDEPPSKRTRSSLKKVAESNLVEKIEHSVEKTKPNTKGKAANKKTSGMAKKVRKLNVSSSNNEQTTISPLYDGEKIAPKAKVQPIAKRKKVLNSSDVCGSSTSDNKQPISRRTRSSIKKQDEPTSVISMSNSNDEQPIVIPSDAGYGDVTLPKASKKEETIKVNESSPNDEKEDIPMITQDSSLDNSVEDTTSNLNSDLTESTLHDDDKKDSSLGNLVEDTTSNLNSDLTENTPYDDDDDGDDSQYSSDDGYSDCEISAADVSSTEKKDLSK